ncbi:tRNA (adenosine(37)-N6)-dimethylallyltransferase MiaA [Bacilli bacterium]|uniref:tRNA (adenosine(37)-N6)-dimethylallyltransferase MiaA n=1 Tax=Oceanobacillus caeni TaxID=405946 RepID=UPI0006227186|nr:tRNA (adenosine(37)-N6)-dimethylallyltransferase MiaA [Oceanobacillus caeni]KKE78438.1 tRNA delta(2)-isopentenylpyrophosphate transferase [Bacilli bacterium VT-13-104]PZD87799.1 tRNA (adenosine(37)-N6)-dimethylallyltransferase MiaA [Bacilli bacterium]MBU8792208.1 tRNA (adenosine(37)-N6)-dimethylallyltransferase MiaA [Oceanobacillus caeni]PZD88605.1 tRNA (adenosine(37)-N6)-dimethylallyltransferase MiaA [Bacilli bacterium]PZD89898.1 tRNA (adenosine(37)-N6)-dimethylallyltransferase MiaA [Bacil
MKNTVISIMGPTAVGKTSLSIEVAKRFNGEIISGDSMQVYKEMNIGTAKIKKTEMENIPHHMIDIREPDEEFSVADFKQNVQYYIEEISNRNKLPILVGGSGLYIQAALYNYHFSNQKRDEVLTQKLEKRIEEEGPIPVYNYLKEIDPVQAEKIHPNNYRRVIRALEIYETTGKTMTEYQKEQTLESPYHLILIGLEMDRPELYERINHRVDKMLEEGLIQEVKLLIDKGYENCQSMNAIGYKELVPYVRGEISLNEAVETLKRNSRRYAKRQYTWFKNKMNINWYDMSDLNNKEKFHIILDDIAGILHKR